MPDVSVVIPTYNRRALVQEAIASCLDGRGERLSVEVTVVDDGSTDGTREMLQALAERERNVRPFFQEHQGAQVARNRGLKEARGSFIKFLDDDDLLAEGALQEEVEALRTTGASVSYGHLSFTGSDDDHTFRQKRSPDLISGIFAGGIKTHPSALLYRREALHGLRWDPALSYHQDKAFALRVASQCPPAVHTDRVVGIRRKHGGQSISGSVKAATPDPDLWKRRVESIWQAVHWLRDGGKLEGHHRRAAAAGIWIWAHMLSGCDLGAFRRCYAKVQALAPSFEPPRENRLLSAIDRLASPAVTEHLLYPLRKTKHRLS